MVSVAVVCAFAPPAVAGDPDALSAPGWADAWQQTTYPGVAVEHDVPLTMSDGTVLKANVYRPADDQGRAVDTPFPAIVTMTPYTKLMSDLTADMSGPLAGQMGITPELVRAGYVEVVADVRGTGFSEGVWDVLGAREQADTLEVIDWASHQPWSNGKIGMTGASYLGITAVQAAAHRPPALKAILPIIPGSDLFRDIVGTGGAIGIGFMPMWLSLVNGLKWVPDLQALLQGRFDATWLSDRLADPATELPQLFQALSSPDLSNLPPSTVDLAGYSDWYRERQSDPSQIQVPTFVVGGWHDIFANSEPKIYDAIPLPPGEKQLVMGNGYHATATVDFGSPGAPPQVPAFQRAWFDKWLKGIDNGVDSYGPVTLYQQGGGWRTTDSFPRPDLSYERRYLTADSSASAPHAVADGSLSAAPPATSAQLTVAPGIRGVCSRQASEGTAGVALILGKGCELDSRFAEAEALTFTTAPADAPTALSGPMNLHLNTVLDATDGFWDVSVNDIAPDGTSTVISSGQLTAALRAVDPQRSRRTPDGDYIEAYHPLDVTARDPQIPGQPTTLDIGLLATDAVIQPGHRLRIDVYAASILRALPLGVTMRDSGLRPQHIQLDPADPSFVTLPIQGRSGF
ncbi:MAG: cocE 1 [Nocardia sp.]|uniref:CocE/NonD family hydrolase n=1 Tax=Nocardia sp. TaxID=1821 RepID=UPI002616AD87|nr:CocE/NonD family hydrolase [Nocardia sp.]MCU1647396.1 cocE 1 [Nocardia sp.]